MEEIIYKKLESYKRKFYTNELIRGLILLTTAILFYTLAVSSVEFVVRLGMTGRTVLFFLSMVVILGLFLYLVARPILALARLGKAMSNEVAASQIGKHFPEIDDKLLNMLQLNELSANQSSLIVASIERRVADVTPIPFQHAIDLRINLKYLRFLIPVCAIFLLAAFSFPGLIRESTGRIVQYNREFIPEAPFTFRIENDRLEAFKNDDFNLILQLDGDDVPESVYLSVEGRTIKMERLDVDRFSYLFANVQRDIAFQFRAAGFNSRQHQLDVYSRPELVGLNIELDYPSHTPYKDETVANSGNLSIPEGTNIKWIIAGRSVGQVEILFDTEETLTYEMTESMLQTDVYRAMQSTGYEIQLRNEHGSNSEDLRYYMDVIEDEFPQITVDFFSDTILYEYVILSGGAGDDYGISSIRVLTELKDTTYSTALTVNPQTNQQSFYHRWEPATMSLTPDENVRIYVEVWDNDQVKGPKRTISQRYSFTAPDKKDIRNSLAAKSAATEDQLDKSIDEAEELNSKLKEVEDRLKSKRTMEWQEEKLLSEILDQRKELEKQIDQLNSNYNELREAENKFEDRSERIKEKTEQLQELMENLLDEETKQMYEELQRLLDEKRDIDEIREQLNRLSPDQESVEKELERALELFKRLKLESELEQASNDFKELGEEQEQLGEKVEEGQVEQEEAIEEQNAIEEEFDRLKEKLEEINELNQDLKSPEPLENTQDEQQEIDQNMEEIQQQLKEGKPNDAGKMQQNSGKQMKRLGQRLESMQMNMEMEMMQVNIENLQNILDDLVKLSHTQEDLLESFKQVRQVDPRFVELSQQQLKLKDDAKVIEDSLLSLAEQVVQISSFVTREVNEVNRNIDAAVQNLRERNRSKALSNQQYAMTSINNLALLLSNTLQQMQMSMSESMKPGQGQPKQGQPNMQQGLPNMKQLQQQLSDRIKRLKDSGAQGRQLSEELAKMAAEQEMIRNELQRLQEQLDGQLDEGSRRGSDNLGKAIEEMEKNEIDLVNKRLTRELINRQELIQTRLLEAEDALREQKLDEKREGETATAYEKRLPPAFDEYLKARQKEIELLKTVPLDLNPFYKKEVNDYFRRLSNQK